MSTSVKADTSGFHIEEFLDSLKALCAQDDERLQLYLMQLQNEWKQYIIGEFHSDPSSLKQRLDEADEALEKLKDSMKILRSSVEQENRIDWSEKGKNELRDKKYEDAFQSLQKGMNYALAANQEITAEEFVLVGSAALHSRRLGEAETYAEKALDLETENVKALMLKGLVHYTRKEFEFALQVFSKARELSPDSARIKKYYDLTTNYLNTDPMKPAVTESFTGMTNIIDPSEKREWERAVVDLKMTINDFENMTSSVIQVTSLSAGGCLVEPESPDQIPDEFNFQLDLGDEKRVHGYAQKAYLKEDGKVGILFKTISDDHRDLINERILCGVYC